jgi:hypothetical protein
MTDIEELERIAREANLAVSEARDKLRDQENKAVIGKCFRTRNNYSCPEKPTDYWWLYVRVVGVRHGSVVCHLFETDKYGKVMIDFNAFRYAHSLDQGYTPISRAQYDKAWKALMKRLGARSR